MRKEKPMTNSAHTFSISARTTYVLTHSQMSADNGSVADMASFRHFDDALMAARALQASIPGSDLTLPNDHE